MQVHHGALTISQPGVNETANKCNGFQRLTLC